MSVGRKCSQFSLGACLDKHRHLASRQARQAAANISSLMGKGTGVHWCCPVSRCCWRQAACPWWLGGNFSNVCIITFCHLWSSLTLFGHCLVLLPWSCPLWSPPLGSCLWDFRDIWGQIGHLHVSQTWAHRAILESLPPVPVCISFLTFLCVFLGLCVWGPLSVSRLQMSPSFLHPQSSGNSQFVTQNQFHGAAAS